METGGRPLSDIPAINRFLSYCRIRTVPSKTVLIHAGDVPDVLYYVINGSVEVLIEDEEGNEMVLAYLNKGQFFGEMGLFNEQPARSAWVRTRTQCELAEMTYPRFRQIAAESPTLLFELATQLASRLDRTNRKLGDLAFVDVTGRVAHAIMDLCNEPDAMTHPEGMQIKVSRQELSRLVGCSREMAGRVLKVLEEQGLLTRARQDHGGLRRAAAAQGQGGADVGRPAERAVGPRPARAQGDHRRRRRRGRRRRGREPAHRGQPGRPALPALSASGHPLSPIPAFPAIVLAHGRDRRAVVLRPEDRRARDERVGARGRDRARCCRPSRRRPPRGGSRARCARSIRAPCAIFGSADGMNDCPPKPGFTDISSTMSILSST